MDAGTTGRFIAQRRKQMGYTQKDLAEKLMVTDKAVSRWETGKGFPDTSLLKPLGDLLGVSVGELLAGREIAEVEMKEQTDRILLDSLKYSGRMMARMVNLVLVLAGLALLLLPLFLAGQSYAWAAGVVLLGIAAFRGIWKRKGETMKIADKTLYIVSVAAQAAVLLLETLPLGAVLIFAPGPTERTVRTFSYFDLMLVGYGSFAPLLTGVLTAAAVVLGGIALWKYPGATKIKNARFMCGILSAALSLVPLLMLGGAGMTAVSYAVTAMTVVSLCLQAAANRKE